MDCDFRIVNPYPLWGKLYQLYQRVFFLFCLVFCFQPYRFFSFKSDLESTPFFSPFIEFVLYISNTFLFVCPILYSNLLNELFDLHTLRFTLHAVNSMHFSKCLVFCIHHYRIIQDSVSTHQKYSVHPMFQPVLKTPGNH